MREETGTHLRYLDGWRGIAVLFVLIGHFAVDEMVKGFSSFGVDLFFVLSGRLMAEILFIKKSPLRLFFFRRFSRVYPALLFFVVVVTVAFAGTDYGHKAFAAILALTFTLNYAMIFTHPVALLDHLWSLCVEEHAYIILAGIALLLSRAYQSLWIIGFIGLAALMNGIYSLEVLQQSYFDVFWRTDVQIAPIFIAAAFHLYIRQNKISPPYWLAPVCLISGVCLKLIFSSIILRFGFATIFLALAVVTIDFSSERYKSFFETKWLTKIGLLSFSLYLWQQPFYKLHRDGVAPAVALLGMAVVTSIAAFYMVERPSRNFLNRAFSGWVSLSSGKKSQIV